MADGHGNARRAEGRCRVRRCALRRPDWEGFGHRSGHAITSRCQRQFFSALADVGVNIEMISTSEIRISVIVDQDDVDRAVVAAHTALGLDTAEEAIVYAGTGR